MNKSYNGPQHPLIEFLFELKGNPKVCLLIEPLWGIPFNLIAPFATLYMSVLGVTDVQIGLLLSITMLLRVFFSFSGGIISDKYGRLKTTLIYDSISWIIAPIVWAISQNFWFFLIAMSLNCFEQVAQTSWSCLLIEDTEEKNILNIYLWITIAGLLSVFFAPISGILINKFSLVPVIRVIYAIFAINMVLKVYITYKYTTETCRGKIRMEETKGVSSFKMVAEYKYLIPQIFKNKATMQTLAVMVIIYTTNMINTSFFGIYANAGLGIPEKFLAIFPILRAIVMILFLFGIQHMLNRIKLKIPMQIGFVIYVLSQAILVFSPKNSIIPVVVYIFLDAVSYSLVVPRKDSMLIITVDAKERARIMALLLAFSIAFASPFGYIAGFLSSLDRRLPFVLNAAMYILAFAVIARFHERGGEDEAGAVEA